jgi:hypothetical protein
MVAQSACLARTPVLLELCFIVSRDEFLWSAAAVGVAQASWLVKNAELNPWLAGSNSKRGNTGPEAARRPVPRRRRDPPPVAACGSVRRRCSMCQGELFRGRLPQSEIQALHGAIVRIRGDAVQSACIAYSHPGRFNEADSYQCYVCDRACSPWLSCGCPIRHIAQGGRSTYYCPGCQK